MAFASDLLASPDGQTAVTTSQRTYGVLSYPGPGRSTRIDAASSSTEPNTLEISHRVEGTGDTKRDVHVVTVRRKKLNSTTGKLIESAVTLSVRVPTDNVTVTAAMIRADLNCICNAIISAGGAFDRLLRGEV